jgi:hypothetical protein
MAARELDLIPASYRERLKIKLWCQLFLAVLVLLVALLVIAKFSIAGQTKVYKAQISRLQKDKSFNLQQQQTYNDLLALEISLQKNLEILDGLRGGPVVRQILLVIDRILDGSVWFTQWSFIRAGELMEVKPQTVQKGYFIIIPQETSGNSKQQAWKLNTHMEIKGQARDFSSLSYFVGKLLKQPEIDDVKVINTSLRNYVEYQVVDFNLVVIINNQFRANDV